MGTGWFSYVEARGAGPSAVASSADDAGLVDVAAADEARDAKLAEDSRGGRLGR
jgi:hypothetical protein